MLLIFTLDVLQTWQHVELRLVIPQLQFLLVSIIQTFETWLHMNMF